MGRRKGLFGRKDSKSSKKTQQQQQQQNPQAQNQQNAPPRVPINASGQQQHKMSPQLAAKAAKESAFLDGSLHSARSASSSTVFVPVNHGNEDSNNSKRSIRSSKGSGSLSNSQRSMKQSPNLPRAKPAHAPPATASATTSASFSADSPHRNINTIGNSNSNAFAQVKGQGGPAKLPDLPNLGQMKATSSTSSSRGKYEVVSIPPNMGMQPTRGPGQPQPQSQPHPPQPQNQPQIQIQSEFGVSIPLPNMRLRRNPSVKALMEELFRIDDDDFIGCERCLRLLRETLEVEGMSYLDGLYPNQRRNQNRHHSTSQRRKRRVDPEKVFECIREVSERFLSRFSELEHRRNLRKEETLKRRAEEYEHAQKKKSTASVGNDEGDANVDGEGDGEGEGNEKEETTKGEHCLHSLNASAKENGGHIEIPSVPDEESNAHSRTNSTSNSNPNRPIPQFNSIDMDEEFWRELEQICWEIFELAMWCCAILAKLYVGPAYNYQLKDRRMRLQAARFEKSRRSRSSNTTTALLTDSSVTSTLTPSRASRQRTISFMGGGTPVEGYMSENSSFAQPPSNQSLYPLISERLPLSMLQFTASFGDAILPPVKYPESVVLLNRNGDGDVADNHQKEDDEIQMLQFRRSMEELVWEEQRSLIRRQRLGEAQRELTAALITDELDDDMDNNFEDLSTSGRSASSQGRRRYKWSIPGAHEPVAMMVCSWVKTTLIGWPDNALKKSKSCHYEKMSSTDIQTTWGAIANNGPIDWWNAFQVSKSVSDLTIAGWRPPPDGGDREESVLLLLALGVKGILLLPQDLKNDPENTNGESREERLAAASAAAEAMAALNHLGARGCLPQPTVKPIARTLCYLLSVTDPSISNVSDLLFPVGADRQTISQGSEIGIEIEDFMGQRESCLHEIAELLWSMMARNASMALTTDVLLCTLKVDLSQDKTDSFNDDIFFACGAVRSLGASFWGSPPAVKGNSSLRLCWSLFLGYLAETSTSIHDRSLCVQSPIERETPISSSNSISSRLSDAGKGALGDVFLTIPRLNEISIYDSMSLVFILEIVIAVRRLVDGPMTNGVDLLSINEWEQFLSLLEMGFLPWFANCHVIDNKVHVIDGKEPPHFGRNMDLMQKIQTEISGIFHQLKIYLGNNEDGVHRIIDTDIRRRFHLLFFRVISPLLPMADSTLITLSVIDSWVRGGAISFSSNDWHKKCSSLLSEAFARYEDIQKGYDGGYVHAPHVRQAALRALVVNDQGNFNQQDNSSLSTPAGSSDVDQNLVARNAQSIHADMVCRVLTPYLSEVLLVKPGRNGLLLPEPFPVHPIDDKYKVLDKEGQQLLLTCVQVTGDILRSPSLEKRESVKLIKILRRCALDTPTTTQRRSSNGLLGDVLKLNDWGGICKLKLEAVRQIGLSLRSCFESHMDSHAPILVEVLIEIVRTFNDNADHPNALLVCQIVSVASMFQLACLRLRNDGKTMLVDEVMMLKSFPSTTADFICRIRFVMDIIASHSDADDDETLQEFLTYQPESLKGSVISSAIKITVADPEDDTKPSGVELDLQPLVDAIKCVLGMYQNQQARMKTNDMPEYFKFIVNKCVDVSMELEALCYETLHNFIQCGLVKLPLMQWREISSFIKRDQCTLSQCKLLSSHSPFVTQTKSTADSCSFFSQLLASCTSRDLEVARVACHGLSACIATISREEFELSHPCSGWHQDACSVLLDQIQALMESRNDTVILLLSTLLNIISTYRPNLHSLSDRTKANIVILCDQICFDYPCDQVCLHTCLLCLQCVSAAVATMGLDELSSLISRISGRRGSFSSGRETVEESETSQFGAVILDLLVQHCLSQAESHKSRLRGPKRNVSGCNLTDVELVAKEIEDIEAFDVTEYDGQCIGAWLCSDLVLTCRVGSNRFHGWVEIILRSPSTRVRKVVRLSKYVSLKSPDLPCNLWDIALGSNKENSFKHIRQDSLRPGALVPPTVETKTMSGANKQINRFKIFDEMRKDQQGLKSIHSSGQNISLRSFMGLSAEEINTIKHSAPKEGVGKLKPDSKATQASDGGFLPFLHSALRGDEQHIEEVENALHELDCSISLFDSVYDYSDEPQPLKWGTKLRRAINILDRTAFLQTHKIALTFAGPPAGVKKQSSRNGEVRKADTDIKDDSWILNVKHASPLFSKFSQGLGKMASLKHLRIFSGGLDTSDYASDGTFALCWIEHPSKLEGASFIGKTMVLFHSVPLMPSGVNNRKRHVGNDVVHIVFCEDASITTHGNDFGTQIISGEFCFATIFVIPMRDNSIVSVTLKLKEDLDEKLKENLTHLVGSAIMPFDASPVYVRQLAMRADLACRSVLQDRLGLFSNWQERIIQIRSLKRYAESHAS